MPIKITTLGQALAVQAAQKSKPMMGKKVLKLGTEYELVFRKKNGELALAGMVGRNCSYDDLGMTFVRLLDKQMEYNEETNRITEDRSGMDKWAILSNIIHNAKMAQEIEAAKLEAQNIASRSGKAIDEVALNQKISDINKRYNPGKDDFQRKDIVQKLVRDKRDFSIITDVLLVPLDPKNGNAAIMSEAVACEIQLSPKKQRDLETLLTNSNYNDFDDPDGYLHVKWSYVGTTPQEAGRNTYMGLEKALRKVDLTRDENGTFVNPVTQQALAEINKLTGDSDAIFNSSNAVAYAKTSADLDIAMRQYLAKCDLTLTYIDFEDEYTNKNLDVLKELEVFSKDSKQYQELLAMIDEKNANKEDDAVKDLAAQTAREQEMEELNMINDIASAKTLSQSVEKLNAHGISNEEVPLFTV